MSASCRVIQYCEELVFVYFVLIMKNLVYLGYIDLPFHDNILELVTPRYGAFRYMVNEILTLPAW